MEIKIPTDNGIIIQPNQGDFRGNIWASWNMDFLSNPGAIRVSPMTIIQYTGDATFSYPSAYVVNSMGTAGTDIAWVLAGQYLYFTSSGTLLSSLTKDTTGSSPTCIIGRSDMVNWIDSTGATDILVVSLDTSIMTLTTGGSWTGRLSGALTTSLPHPMYVGFNNLLAIGNGNQVKFYDTSWTATHIITIPKDMQVVWIRGSNSTYYIGAKNIRNSRAKIYSWDGSSQNFTNDYRINGSETFAGCVLNEVPYTINEHGELLALSGAGFTKVAQLPVYNTDYVLNSGLPGASSYLGVYPNAMVVQDSRIHIGINGGIGSYTQYLESQLSGIWVYEPTIGLHHKYSISKGTDFGSPIISQIGFLNPIGKSSGNIIIGSSLWDDGDTTLKHYIQTIESNDSGTTPKIGYFTTPKFATQSVQENWQKAWLVIKEFLSSESKIRIKFRVVDKIYTYFGGVPARQAVWVDTSSFTSPYVTSELSVGDEVEILSGKGSGLSSTITGLSGTYVISLADTVTGASGTILFRASNWKDCGTDINIQGLENFKIPLAENSTWIQFKVVGFFTGKEEIKQLIIKSDPQLVVK
jgi:hypothetical protein